MSYFLSLKILIGFVDLDGYAGVSLRAMFLNLLVIVNLDLDFALHFFQIIWDFFN